ncbi:MAG: TonB-dependent receptor [Proteiniphilum sp.]
MGKNTIEGKIPVNNLKYILRIMRITLFMLFFCIFISQAATGYSQELTLEMKSTSIKEVCEAIEKRSEYRFIFAGNTKKIINKKVNLSANSQNIEDILDNILSNTELTYRILGNQVAIYRDETEGRTKVVNEAISKITIQQKKIITGRITDAKGEPIIGANIIEVGSTNGTVTDINGNFSLSVEQDAAIHISYIGYLTQEINTAGKNHLNIIMQEDTQSLEEVVVVGYGVQKKESVVGAISTAKGEDLLKTGGLTNISSALTGLVPGLVTLNVIGKPGADQAEILIRGKSTWNNSAPLILVDGIERGMNDVDVNEVESISVLKDASATAVYGVRGANGVILITTKRGKDGKISFKFGANATLKMISKMPTYANSYESRWMRNEAIEIQTPSNETSWSYYTPYEILMHYKNQDLPYLFPDVDWRKETVRDNTWVQRYNLEISGGTNFMNYYAALSYLNDSDIIKIQDFGQGYLPENNFKRLNFRTNLDFHPTKTTTFSVDIDGSQGKVNSFGAPNDKSWDGLYGKAPDLYPVRYEDGTFAWSVSLDERQMNPVYAYNFSGMSSKTTTDINTTFRLDQKLDKIIKGLSAKGIASFQNIYATNGPGQSGNPRELKYIDPYTGEVEITFPLEYLNLTHGFNYVPIISTTTSEVVSNSAPIRGAGIRNLMYQVSLNYNREIDKHLLGGLLLFKRQERTIENDFTNYREEWAGRITYEYDRRYLLESNIGYNGSEQFGPGYKFGFFPSFALGWNLGNEEFFSDNIGFMNKFKFRFSKGKVGNDNAGGSRWLYLSSWAYGGYIPFGNENPSNSPYQLAYETNIGNPNLRWETATKNDFAIETGFFNNSIIFNFDYFWGHRKDIFMSSNQRNIAPWFGADPVVANLGEVKDKGWEIELGLNKMSSFGLKYYANLNLSYAENEIIYMEDPELTPNYMKNAGFPIGQVRLTPYSDIIRSWDEMYTGVMNQVNNTSLLGDFRFVDYNANGFIDGKDAVPYGYADHPQIINNYTFGADYKGLSLMVQFYSTRNSTLSESLIMWGATYMNQSIDRIVLDNAWIPSRENTARPYHRANWNFPGASGDGQYNRVDGTLWRLKTAEIAYTITNSFIRSMGIDNARVYVNGNNLWLWSHLNEDRETGGTRGDGNFEKYPLTKRINFGMNISF